MTEREAKQLEMLTEKVEQLRAQQNVIIMRDKQRKKKERTRNLIKCGEIAERYLKLENADPAEFEKRMQANFNPRTQNLIQCGVIAEKYFGLTNADFATLEKILANLTSPPDFKNYLQNLKYSLTQSQHQSQQKN